jgi:AraC-like DNA-binding protein
MHPVAFSRAFRRCFGKAPLAYGLEARLRSSAQDLARGASPISDIAQRWGFFDQAHFSRHFQTCFGASPGQFRRIFQS